MQEGRDAQDPLGTEHRVTAALPHIQAKRAVPLEPAPTTGPEFDRFVASEIQQWGRIVKTSGATAE